MNKICMMFVVAMLGITAFAKDAVFTTLPFCRRVEGKAEVRQPSGDWMEIEEGKFYPLGSSYRTGKSGKLEISFGPSASVKIAGEAEFGTRPEKIDATSRTVVLVGGTVNLVLADNLPEGKFFATASGFTVKNPAGESTIAYETTGDGDIATIRCVTGTLGVEGRHFDIGAMRAADEVVIRSSHDFLSTVLSGTSGDYIVKLDQGICTKEDINDDGQVVKSVEKGVKEWHLSPKTRVVINRSLPSIGERMSVHTMAFDAAGSLKSECSFCEGRAEVNSGELVAKDKIDGEELAKRAAEATETTEATDDEEATAAENDNNKSSGSEEE